jgi:hypothetical protein
MAAQAGIKLLITAKLDAAVDIGVVEHEINYQPGYNFSDGTGLNEIKQIFSDSRTLAASTNEDLDLAGGLVNALGQTLTFTKIRGIIVRAAAANTNNVVVGNATSNGFATWVGAAAHTLIVRPGGMLALFAPDATGYAVTASTGDLLRIANSGSGSSVTYDLILIGTTA